MMLTFSLDYLRDGIVMYSYMPEGDDTRVGHVGMEVDTGKRLLPTIAPGDECKSYAFHMLKRIDRFRSAGDFENNGIVAWY